MCNPDSTHREDVINLGMRPGLLYSDRLFGTEALAGLLDVANMTTATVDYGSELYNLISSFLTDNSDASSFRLQITGQPLGRGKGCGKRITTATLGLGSFAFAFEGSTIIAVHQCVGEPVGTDCGPALLKTLTLAIAGKGPESIAALEAFGSQLVERADRTDKRSFTVYRWSVQCMYWKRDSTVMARSIDSVVLPAATKERIVDDVSDFLSHETHEWYVAHGIPYKRAYLFHGAPGAGKTSLIQALAGKYQRNVCYLSPTHPDMTDDNLKSAVQMVPANSILVLEDIDALFGAKREKKVEKSPLTFSGLLNAIDGVGGACGQIFILTTNHRERLDPALIRNGRVDLHVEFTDAGPEQMGQLFAQFYPRAEDALAVRFAEKLAVALDGQSVSMAALQHYFIVQRKASAEEAADGVEAIVTEMKERQLQNETKAAEEVEAKGVESAKPEEEEAKPALEGGNDKGKDAEDGTPSDAGGIHVHVHLPAKK